MQAADVARQVITTTQRHPREDGAVKAEASEHIHDYCDSACCFVIQCHARSGLITVSEKTHSFGEEHMWEHRLFEHDIRGPRAVSAVGLQGKG